MPGREICTLHPFSSVICGTLPPAVRAGRIRVVVVRHAGRLRCSIRRSRSSCNRTSCGYCKTDHSHNKNNCRKFFQLHYFFFSPVFISTFGYQRRCTFIPRHPTENTVCKSFGLALRFGLHPRLNTRKFSGITEQSRKPRKYVILEFRDFLVLFRDVSACSVFSVGGNTINDEGGMARDESKVQRRYQTASARFFRAAIIAATQYTAPTRTPATPIVRNRP